MSYKKDKVLMRGLFYLRSTSGYCLQYFVICITQSLSLVNHFFSSLPFFKHRFHLHRFIFTHNRHLYFIADTGSLDKIGKLSFFGEFFAIDFKHDIILAYTCLVGGGVLNNRFRARNVVFNNQSAIINRQLVFLLEVLVEHDVAQTDERSDDATEFYNVFQVGLGPVNRKREADILGTENYSGI